MQPNTLSQGLLEASLITVPCTFSCLNIPVALSATQTHPQPSTTPSNSTTTPVNSMHWLPFRWPYMANGCSRKGQLQTDQLGRKKILLSWKKWTHTNKLSQLFSYSKPGIIWRVFIPSRCLLLVWFSVMNLKTKTCLYVVNSKYQRSLQSQKPSNEGEKETATTEWKETIKSWRTAEPGALRRPGVGILLWAALMGLG